MTHRKFAFPLRKLCRCVRFFRLIKTVHESSRMDRRAETDSGEGRRDQLGAGVRKANAEIQSGSYFGRFERPNDVDRMVVHRRVGFV
jgi:hypothetical protein